MSTAAATIVDIAHPDINDYVAWLQRQGMSEKTVTLRSRFALQVLRKFGTWDVPGEVLHQWLSHYTGWSRRTYQNHLNSLYAWLTEVGMIEVSPTERMRRPRAPRPRPRPLTDAELNRAMSAAPPRLRTMLMLASLAGLRAHEVAKFHGEDITEQTILVCGKGGLEASVPTHPDLWQIASDYPRNGYWFPSLRDGFDHVTACSVSIAIGRLFTDLGIDGSIHRCRHTYGTRLVRAGNNIRVVQDLMRHTSLDTTALYLGVNEEERRAAIRSLGSGS